MRKINYKNPIYINIRGTSQPYWGSRLLLPEFNITIINTKLGNGVSIWGNVNIYGAEIGENTKIGSFVEIGRNVKIGENCKIETGAFIPEGVLIGDNVFVGPYVTFTNDRYPSATDEDWQIHPTVVNYGASIGANSTIMCGIEVGKNAVIGMGSVVLDDVPDGSKIYGNKARRR